MLMFSFFNMKTHVCVCVMQHIGSEVQKEFFLLFTVIDENESWYLEKNMDQFGSEKSNLDSQIFQESNKMHCKQCHCVCTCV